MLAGVRNQNATRGSEHKKRVWGHGRDCGTWSSEIEKFLRDTKLDKRDVDGVYPCKQSVHYVGATSMSEIAEKSLQLILIKNIPFHVSFQGK